MKNSCFDLVLIVGPDTPNIAELKEKYQKLEKEKGFSCLVIGDGMHPVKEADLAPLANRLGSNTRIDINGHGWAGNKAHSIDLVEGLKPTAEIFAKLKTLAGDAPVEGMQVHLWSCFGGAAEKDYDKLPAGAVLMAYASEDKVSLVRMNRESIAEGIMRYQPQKSPSESVDQALKEYAHYLVVSPETMSVRYMDIKHTVRTPIMPVSMEETKRLLASKQEQYVDTVRESASGNKALIDDIKSLPITDDALAAYAKNAYFIQALRGNKKYVNEYLKQPAIHPDKLLDSDGGTAFHYVAITGGVGVVDTLIKAGINIDLKDKEGRTALSSASSRGHSGLVDMLVKVKAKLDLADNYGWTALSYAASRGHSGVVNILASANADLEIPNNDGRTALSIAAANGHSGVVDSLVRAGAKLDVADKYGWNPLHVAAKNGHSNVVDSFSKAGANLDLAHNDWTALHLAAEKGDSGVVDSLIKAGAQLNLKENNGRTALQNASLKGHAGVVRLLVAAGAALETGFWNRSAKTLASSHGHTEVVDILKHAAEDRKAQEPTLKKIVGEVKDIPELKSFYKESKANKELVKSVITSLLNQFADKQDEVTAQFPAHMKTCLKRGEKLTAANIIKISDEQKLTREPVKPVYVHEISQPEAKVAGRREEIVPPIVPPRPKLAGSWVERVQAQTQTSKNILPGH